MVPTDHALIAAQLTVSAQLSQLAAQLRGERLSDERALTEAIARWEAARARLAPEELPEPIASDDDLGAGALLGDRFRVTSMISRGRSFLARDEQLDREVSVLLLPEAADERGPEIVSLIRREALGAGRGDHPNIARVLATGLLDLTPWLAVEQHRGPTLRQAMIAGALDREAVFAIVLGLAAGVQAMHEAGVVHGDLCPEMVILDGKTPKILGFWSALVGPWVGRTPVSAHRRYLAPENLLQGRLDTRSDLYSLGVIAFELLTGRPPEQPVSPPSGLSPALSKALMTALSLDPDQRPQWARDFAASLRAAWDPWA